MKKIFFTLILSFVFFINHTFAQKTKISDKEAIKKIKTIFCDCSNETFKGFSLDFHRIFEQMAKDIRTKNQVDVTAIRKHFEENEPEFQKFESLNGGMTGGNICELDYEELFDWDQNEFSTFFAKNINQIIALMRKDKKCSKGLVIMSLWLVELNKK